VSRHRTAISTPTSWLSTLMMWLTPVLIIAFAASMHVLGPMLGDYGLRILLNMSIAIVAAVSLTIVNGLTGQFSIGHAAFMALGGYVAAFMTYYTALWLWKTPQADPAFFSAHQLLLLAAAIVGGFVAAGAGWLVGLPSLRLRGDYLAIVTLGFGEILRVLLQQTGPQVMASDGLTGRSLASLLLPPAVNGAQGFIDLPDSTNLFVAYLVVAVTFVFAVRLKRSSLGRAMISIREDEIAAESMGVDVTRLKVRAFMLAAFFAGVAGALYAHQPATSLRPVDAGFQRSFDIVIMVVLGGLGSVSGAAMAAVLVTLLDAWLIAYGSYRMILFALVLILMMIFRPQGLLGLNEVWDLFRNRSKGNRTPTT
jgi:branched-chain amino acid transport system permease protein